jgi:hypothetical protein
MLRHLPVLGLTVLAALLAGCGLAETAATGAAAGASATEQAREAKATEQRVQKEIDAAQQAAAERREQADAAQ